LYTLRSKPGSLSLRAGLKCYLLLPPEAEGVIDLLSIRVFQFSLRVLMAGVEPGLGCPPPTPLELPGPPTKPEGGVTVGHLPLLPVGVAGLVAGAFALAAGTLAPVAGAFALAAGTLAPLEELLTGTLLALLLPPLFTDGVEPGLGCPPPTPLELPGPPTKPEGGVTVGHLALPPVGVAGLVAGVLAPVAGLLPGTLLALLLPPLFTDGVEPGLGCPPPTPLELPGPPT